jgi:AraC-like DNA-binding protein
MARIDPRNTTRYWHDRRVAGLSCLHADFTAHDYAPHAHDALVVAVTELGGAEFTSRGATGEARSSVLLVFNPAEPHSGRMRRSRRWRYRSLYLAGPAITSVTAALGLERPTYFMRNVLADADLIAAFEALHRALDAGCDALHEQELLVGSFGRLFRRYGSGGKHIETGPRDRARLAAIADLMAERHAETLTLEEIGATVGLTPFQLIGLFKRTVGLTPHAYLTQLRLKAAMRDLASGAAIAEAALAAGFYDQSALTRHFKRSFGITPLQFVHALST